MSNNDKILPTLASLFAFWCAALEVLLLVVGGTFGEYSVVGADKPIQIALDSYPLGLIWIATVFILFYACWAAGGAVTDREWMGASAIVRGAAASAMSSILLLCGLLLLISTHLRGDNVLSYTIDSRAYILIGLPLGAMVGLLVAAGGLPNAGPTGQPSRLFIADDEGRAIDG